MVEQLLGTSIIGHGRGKKAPEVFTAFDPHTAKAVEPQFHSATPDEVETAVQLADECHLQYANQPGVERAKFLDRIAHNIESLGDTLLERAALETGLTVERFAGERNRTCSTLRMFADLLREGSWVDARIDTAIPDRKPTPKPDIRSMLRPIGPVAVFCASNFPLAYSVAGGDTASALAAGCPVIVNAHTAHPGTAEYVGSAIAAAAKECGMPAGVFSLLFSSGYEVGQDLVKHPAIKAVGFTGSRRGGRALMDLAAARPEPIPVYAEMSSVNPTFLLSSALPERFESIASGLHSSVTTGAGQFCTKPGLVFVPSGGEGQRFTNAFAELLKGTPAAPLLTAGIRDAYLAGNTSRAAAGFQKEPVPSPDTQTSFDVEPSFATVSAGEFLQRPELQDEIFGPTTLLISVDEPQQLLEIARTMEGQLTASVHGTEEDLLDNAELISILETKVGRLIFNGFSTGVEVCPSIVHGGPYPATSDSRSTAVGTRAITRFARLVAYQNFPNIALPPELQDENPLGIWRLVNGLSEPPA